MIYLTVNDLPSGVYYSQVIEVVSYLRKVQNEPVKLVSMIPIRGFFKNRKKIKLWMNDALIIPMMPKIKYWKKSTVFLGLVKDIRNERIIARGVMACSLAMKFNKQVVYDGRAAVTAELDEFPLMIPDRNVRETVIREEKNCVNRSLFRIAISHALVSYWKNKLDYTSDNHVVIPCTLPISEPEKFQVSRDQLGFAQHDIVIVYSGGSGGWQSTETLCTLLSDWINKYKVKVLLLSKVDENIQQLMTCYPSQVVHRWVQVEQVNSFLELADYGILVRDKLLTNQVASPVKFAEYLQAGLKVLISENIGDYSDLVERESLGAIIYSQEIKLINTSAQERDRIKLYARNHFSKECYKSEYLRLFS